MILELDFLQEVQILYERSVRLNRLQHSYTNRMDTFICNYITRHGLYLIDVDGRYEDIRTGGDGYWGDYQELYREINGKKYVDAVVISISMPDDMSFESMKRLAEYFFEDMSPDREPKKADKKKGRDR